MRRSLQLQQSQIGIAVKRAVFALLGHIVLEHSRGLGVVSVEAVEDGFDVSRSGLALIEGDSHIDAELSLEQLYG